MALKFYETKQNMTSSVKPEVHNRSQRQLRRTEPRPYASACPKIWWRSAVRFSSYASAQTLRHNCRDRQTNRHTHYNTS